MEVFMYKTETQVCSIKTTTKYGLKACPCRVVLEKLKKEGPMRGKMIALGWITGR